MYQLAVAVSYIQTQFLRICVSFNCFRFRYKDLCEMTEAGCIVFVVIIFTFVGTKAIT